MINMTTGRDKGFTLIELLVALAIGLLVTLVVLQAYLSGLGTQRAQTDVSRAQESSRSAFDLLARSLRKAGHKDPEAPGTAFCASGSSLQRLVAINDPATIQPDVNLDATSLAGSSVTIANNSDAIRVVYYGERSIVSGAVTNPDGTVRDCLGNPVGWDTRVADTFFIQADSTNNNEPTLFCHTTNPGAGTPNPAPLVPGVESMQLLYGEDTDGDGNVNRYVPASAVTGINNVRSAMLSLVTRTASQNAVDRSQRPFNHFGTSYAPGNAAPSGDAGSVFTAPGDGRIRQHFTTTIALRNLCPV